MYFRNNNSDEKDNEDYNKRKKVGKSLETSNW